MQKHVILRAQLGHGGMWTIYIKRGRENQFLERTFSPPNLLSPAMRARVHTRARARATALQDFPRPFQGASWRIRNLLQIVGPDHGPQSVAPPRPTGL